MVLEIIVDADARSVEFYDNEGRFEHVDAAVVCHMPQNIPSLALPLRSIFAEMEILEVPAERFEPKPKRFASKDAEEKKSVG